MTRAFGDEVGASVGVSTQPQVRQVGLQFHVCRLEPEWEV